MKKKQKNSWSSSHNLQNNLESVQKNQQTNKQENKKTMNTEISKCEVVVEWNVLMFPFRIQLIAPVGSRHQDRGELCG